MTPVVLPTPLRSQHRDWAAPVGVVVALVLLLVGGNLAGNGVPPMVVSGEAGMLPGWEHGSMLRVLAVWVDSWFGFAVSADSGLVLLYVLLAGVGSTVAYRALRVSDWPAGQALLAVALFAANGLLVYAVTTASPEFLLVLVLAALIPARRQLEAVGDVQSIINYSLTLTLLLMAGPPLALILPLLVLAVPLREAEARKKPGVFGAMLLVAVVPTLIIMAGVGVMAARAGVSLDTLIGPLASAVSPSSQPIFMPLLLMTTLAPVGVVMISHLLMADRRRKLLTTLLALLLPVYLLVGNTQLDWRLAAWFPAAAMLATAMGWLGATRIRPSMRLLALVLLAVGGMASWFVAPLWADAAWLDGLMPIRFFQLTL